MDQLAKVSTAASLRELQYVLSTQFVKKHEDMTTEERATKILRDFATGHPQ